MAIESRFLPIVGGEPAPYVRAYVGFPGMGEAKAVDFLIDTGSDSTCLHSGDIGRLGIDYRDLREGSLRFSRGIGGSVGYYVERAWLLFIEATGERRFCELDIHICQSSAVPIMQTLPSLLGRDFLNLCSVHLDNALNLVHLEPRTVSGGFIQ